MQTNLNDLSAEQLREIIAKQALTLEAMKQANQRKLSLKVSEKGAVSVYGFGKWPVTLYGTQWERLLDASVTIRQFLQDNAHLLATKA